MGLDPHIVSRTLADADAQLYHSSLAHVLEQIAPLTAMGSVITLEEQIRQLGRAINLILDELDELNAIVDTSLVPRLIDGLTQHTAATGTMDLQIGVAGDLRIDKRHRLVVEGMVQSIQRVPLSTRPSAVREALAVLRQIITQLLEVGWVSHLAADAEALQTAYQTINEIVQGHRTRLSARFPEREETLLEKPLNTSHTVC